MIKIVFSDWDYSVSMIENVWRPISTPSGEWFQSGSDKMSLDFLEVHSEEVK